MISGCGYGNIKIIMDGLKNGFRVSDISDTWGVIIYLQSVVGMLSLLDLICGLSACLINRIICVEEVIIWEEG